MRKIPNATSYVALLKVYLTSDHISAATGKTVAVTLSKNGGAFANPNAGATNATEIANGWYKVTLDTTDTGTNGDLAIRGTSASCDDCEQLCQVVSATTGGATNLDAAVSTRLAAASYTAPPTSDVAAIKARVETALPNAAPGGTDGLQIVGTNVGLTRYESNVGTPWSCAYVGAGNFPPMLIANPAGTGPGLRIFTDANKGIEIDGTVVATNAGFTAQGLAAIGVTAGAIKVTTDKLDDCLEDPFSGNNWVFTIDSINAALLQVTEPIAANVTSVKADTSDILTQTGDTGVQIADGAITSSKFTVAAVTGVATGFLEKLEALWRRGYRKVEKDRMAKTIKTYADDETTVLTTQNYSETNGVQTVESAE